MEKKKGIAVAILVNEHNKTVGAQLNIDGRNINIKTEQLSERCNEIELSNAVIDVNGFVRAKSGNLKKIQIKERPSTIECKDIQEVKKLLSENPIKLYHGNKDANMTPLYGKGSKGNDYGRGFYTTPDAELGKEWAMGVYTKGSVGYLHKYELDTTNLNILDLTQLDSLHWIAELLANRTLNLEGKEVLRDTIEKFLKKYKLQTDKYDVIIGYRADDRYFTYAEDFVSGTIYKETLENALRYGYLGIQVFIKSKKAFNNLHCVGEPEVVPEKYRKSHEKRKESANNQYRMQVRNKQAARKKETIYDFI